MSFDLDMFLVVKLSIKKSYSNFIWTNLNSDCTIAQHEYLYSLFIWEKSKYRYDTFQDWMTIYVPNESNSNVAY